MLVFFFAAAAGLKMVYDVRGKGVEWAISQFNNTGGFVYSRTVSVLQVPYPPSTSFMGDYRQGQLLSCCFRASIPNKQFSHVALLFALLGRETMGGGAPIRAFLGVPCLVTLTVTCVCAGRRQHIRRG